MARRTNLLTAEDENDDFDDDEPMMPGSDEFSDLEDLDDDDDDQFSTPNPSLGETSSSNPSYISLVGLLPFMTSQSHPSLHLLVPRLRFHSHHLTPLS